MSDIKNTINNNRAIDKTFTILCIDDESVNLKILASIFKEHYKIVACKSASQGFKKAIELTPDLILLDVLMPEEDGFELIKKFKNHPELQHIPIIFITGLQSAEDEEKGLTLGACDYIQKPFNYGIVRARVNTHLEILRQRRLLESFANFDSLTELPNRRKWEKDSVDNWRFALEHRKSIMYGIIDIDFFKLYNDSYGHQQGDIVLRKVANAIKRVLFDYQGAIFRCGGEEFYFYIPTNDNSDVQSILVECLESVTALGIQHTSSNACSTISVSIGAVQVTPNEDMLLTDIMQLADEKLYQVKNKTRNAADFVVYQGINVNSLEKA